MNEFETESDSTEKPWWNDGDKVGGISASILMLAIVTVIAILAIAGAIKLVNMMF